ncbi:MAG: 50S ribosomal protein L5 [Candidatus Woesearchaeota archaeon]
MNQMQQVKLEKITLNIGAGKDQKKLELGLKLLKKITEIEPVRTVTNKRIPNWGLRPGLPIGCKITLRKAAALETLKRLLEAKEGRLRESQFDQNGNIAFGLPEYIDIPGVGYDPEIGVLGLEVCVTLEKPGFRIKKRRLLKRKIPPKHRISRDEAINFMKNNFKVSLGEEE